MSLVQGVCTYVHDDQSFVYLLSHKNLIFRARTPFRAQQTDVKSTEVTHHSNQHLLNAFYRTPFVYFWADSTYTGRLVAYFPKMAGVIYADTDVFLS